MDKLERIARRIASGKPGTVRTAGKIEFIRDQGPIRRDIRVKDFDWSPDSLRNLAKILWATQRAHSYAMSAYRLFSKMPSAEFSPDGMLGGRGYIQNVKDMRSSLAGAVETLSAFTDTVHDEVNGQHWQTAEEAAPTVQPMVKDAEAVKANPEQFVENELEDVEPDVVANPDAGALNPVIEEPEVSAEDEEEDDGAGGEDAAFSQMAAKLAKPKKVSKSQLPTDESEQKQGKTEVEMTMNTTTPDHGSYASAVERVLRAHERRYASSRTAGGDSAIPQGDLPGPRVEHVGPGETEEGWASDDVMGEALGGGVNMSKPLMEDWTADGVSGYEDPTSGDESVLKISRKIAAEKNYSWLPGADNAMSMPYYDRSVTPEQEAWMREHNQPPLPAGIGPQQPQRPRRDEYWEALREE